MRGVYRHPRVAPQIVELQDIRSYLKIDGDYENTSLRMHLAAAEDFIERNLNVYIEPGLITYSLDLPPSVERERNRRGISYQMDRSNVGDYGSYGYDYFNYDNGQEVVNLPIFPVMSLDEVRTIDEDGVSSVVAADNYELVENRIPQQVVFGKDFSWPSNMRRHGGIEIDYTAGYEDDKIPRDLYYAIIRAAGYYYEHRGEDAPPPFGILAGIKQHRVINAG